MKGILGKKIGMTQVFTKEGKLIPVTVVSVEPNVVTQIKTVEKDGYDAVQLATKTIKEKQLEELQKLSLEEHYKYYETKGINKKDIIKQIAKDRNVNKNEIYQKFI